MFNTVSCNSGAHWRFVPRIVRERNEVGFTIKVCSYCVALTEQDLVALKSCLILDKGSVFSEQIGHLGDQSRS